MNVKMVMTASPATAINIAKQAGFDPYQVADMFPSMTPETAARLLDGTCVIDDHGNVHAALTCELTGEPQMNATCTRLKPHEVALMDAQSNTVHNMAERLQAADLPLHELRVDRDRVAKKMHDLSQKLYSIASYSQYTE